MAIGNKISFKELAKRTAIDPVANLLTGLQQGITQNQQQEPTGTIQQLGRFAGGLTREGVTRGADVTGKLAEFATRPETLEVASRIGQLATAYEDPQISNVLGQIATSIGEKRTKKLEREETLAKAASDLKIEDNKAIAKYLQEGFREPREGDDERFIQEITLPSGAKKTYFNQKVAVEAKDKVVEAKDKKIESYTDFVRDLKAQGITPITENENMSKVPKQYIQEYETPDGGKSIFINRKGYNEARVSAKQDVARVKKSIQQADAILNTINKFITTKKGPDGKDKPVLNDIGKAVTTGQGVAGLTLLTPLEPLKQRVAKLTEQPNTKAGSRFLDTLKANLGFKELQEMRQNSKTGGALGNVSDMEIKFLQAAQSAIDFNMPAEEFLTLLQEMKSSAMRLKKDLSRIQTVDNILMEADRSLQTIPMTNYKDMPTGGIEIGEGYSIVREEE